MFDINTDLVDILLFRYYFNWLITCVSLVKQYLFLKIVWISVKDIISKRNSEKHEKAWKEKKGGGDISYQCQISKYVETQSEERKNNRNCVGQRWCVWLCVKGSSILIAITCGAADSLSVAVIMYGSGAWWRFTSNFFLGVSGVSCSLYLK